MRDARHDQVAHILKDGIERLALLREPPAADRHEVSDKGTINQKIALARRADEVERLYAEPPDPAIIRPSAGTA